MPPILVQNNLQENSCMAKSKPKNNKSKKAPKGKTVKPASKSSKKAADKSVKKDKKPAKKEKVKVITKKAAKPASVKGKPVAKNKIEPKKVPAAKTKPVVQPAKAVAPVKPAQKAKTAPAPKGPKSKERPVLTPEQLALPKLPSNIHYKRTKQRLAPGEKRLVKTEVITHHVISDKPIDPQKPSKAEPKGKYQLEFIIRCPVTLLYDFLSTPSGLQEWFADDVFLKDDMYTFNWDGQLQKAQLLNAKIDNYLRFRWIDKPEGTYVEFRVTQDELTGEVSLIVTDFGESEDDVVTGKRLWDSQIQRLIKVMGAY